MAGMGVAVQRVCGLLALAAVAWSAPEARAEEGVYSAEQSARGEALYQQYCAACHGARLQGNPAAPLTGDAFRGRWEDGKHTLDDLYYIIRSLMPNNAPGSLSRVEYADIIAFILRINNYPSGAQELEPKAATMKAVTLLPH
jgi:cytochrome c